MTNGNVMKVVFESPVSDNRLKHRHREFEKLASENPLLPIILITARPGQGFTAMAAGIGALLEKPPDLPRLFLTIQDLLGEPDDVRLARIAGRPSEFHYVPPRADGLG